MRTRLITIGVALAMIVTIPSVSRMSPAVAHSGYTSISDDATADISPDPTINGIPMQVRVLRPTAAAPAGGWPWVIYMAGDLQNRCANINGRVNGTANITSWYTRKQVAEHGFAVLSFNARGMPANINAGVNPSGTSGCTAAEDSLDQVDDSGFDLGGPSDKQDIKSLIDWALANYNPGGCGSPCLSSNVGIIGYAYESLRAFLMAPSPQFDTRVKAVVPVGFEEVVRNLADISSNGTGTYRDVDLGLSRYLGDWNSGYLGHSDPGVLTNTAELLRDKYLNYSVPTGTKTWFDDRTVVDDNSAVDKAHLISIPTMVVSAFLDSEAGTATAIAAYNKIPAATDAYLYLGACGSSYWQLSANQTGPCLTNNATNLRNKVHDFFDKYLRGTAVTMGGPIFYAIPPATNPLSSDSWTVQEDSDGVWPPALSGGTYYTTCLGSDGSWVYPCGTQPGGTRTISNLLSVGGPPLDCACSGSTYSASEVAAYTSAPAVLATKLIRVDVGISMSSNTTRLQVYADLFDVAPGPPEVETRIWQGDAQVVPTVRSGTPGTVYRFLFQPGGNAWTVATGHKLRIKIAANYKRAFAQELLPATYTIYHDNATTPARVYLWYAT